MKISEYKPENEDDLLSAISKEPDWSEFTNENAIDTYKESLKNSITFVCYNDSVFTGYVRAILDKGLSVYISELYVVPEWRGQKIGQSLLERVRNDFYSLAIYALSDEDAYYQKKGYKLIGSVFKI
jgi:GNAT superfamily N-acetyltransferase